ncbi:MATE family efflux transporter [Bifidobacterium vespertilionis]|uniref:Multidrug export protein MepA n=1 Tax=Bifidobacterium vespertilionis TaxID=2562524 RepID=A0A5J5E112_9BIFI|nr:MATE family efflux transporter [Bifidobacterium vespertilionis]KAA8822652.1 MATE family efflux transporter [Bifidobacterium vespertilionis]KAA8824063.1 MATE family efflux transporter [Bifidobacterium vespertilionis]MBT1179172.1 MATE family efflux transporter [Bifidobacterium vespertilionis]
MDNELFERAPIPKAYFSLAMPVVMSMLVTLVYNMVDTYFIAHTGDTNMVAGVSLTAPVFMVMIAIGDIFGLGGSSVISRLFGQHRYADGKRLSVFCFYGSALIGVAVLVLGLAFRTPILSMLGADEATWPHASAYYTWIIIGSPLIIVSMTPVNQLRTEGHAVPSMIGQIAGTVINIILNPLFIHVFGWGAAGSAGATVIANVCTDAYLVWFLLRRSQNLSVDPRLMFRGSRLNITGSELRDVLVIGIPAAVTNLTQSFGVVMVNLYLLPYGNDPVAAMGIALKVVLIAVSVFVGFAFGAQALIGYNYGARDMVRLSGILRFSYLFLSGFALVMTVLLSVFDRQLMGFFISDPRIIDLGAGILRVQLLSLVCVGIVMVTTCTFQSTGKALGAFILSISRQGVVLVVVLAVASRVAGYNGVIAAQAIADLITAVMAIVLFRVLLPELRRRG